MRFFNIISIFLVSSCYISGELPPDQQVWDYDDPGNVGIIEDALLSIDSLLSERLYENIDGLIVIKDDKMVFENYYDSLKSRNTIVSLGRASLVYTVAAIGIAVERGLIDLTDPIYEHLPLYSTIFEDDTLKKEITIEHLLTHKAGFSWNENLTPLIGNPDNNLNQMFASNDWIEFILNRPLQATPGFFYNLNSGTGTILSGIVQNASGQPFDQFLRENLFNTIGVSSFSMDQDPSGNFNGGRGAFSTLIDWTKFGYLMLNGGIWNGRKVIDPNFVEESRSIQTLVSPTFNLGYGWWLFGDNFENTFTFDKDDVYYIPGEMGQHQYIIPSRKMIISIYAENIFFGFGNPSLNLFFDITTALQ